MMRDTPRTFVGSVVLLLHEPVGEHLADDVVADLLDLPGVAGCDLDGDGAVLVLTARAPVDRTEVVALLARHGCRVRP